MFEIYPTKYHDEFGEETTTIQNDGKSLRMTLRGTEFQCSMLDDWEPIPDIANSASFFFHHGELCSYILDCEISVPIVENDCISSGTLRVHFELGNPREDGRIDREVLQLELILNGKSFKSSGDSGWFEDELQEIHTALPQGTYLKSCFNCAFSDYNPAGFGLFGCMACFRHTKKEYLSLKGKDAYFQLQDRMAEFVQETYLCLEFEKRVPNTGYRG
jgi:Family of unknown function (DUF6304)